MDAIWDKTDWKPTMASQIVKKDAPKPAVSGLLAKFCMDTD